MELSDVLVGLGVVILVGGFYRLKRVGLEVPPRDPWAH